MRQLVTPRHYITENSWRSIGQITTGATAMAFVSAHLGNTDAFWLAVQSVAMLVTGLRATEGSTLAPYVVNRRVEYWIQNSLEAMSLSVTGLEWLMLAVETRLLLGGFQYSQATFYTWMFVSLALMLDGVLLGSRRTRQLYENQEALECICDDVRDDADYDEAELQEIEVEAQRIDDTQFQSSVATTLLHMLFLPVYVWAVIG